MGLVASILVGWPKPNVKNFFLPLPKGCKWNFIEIGIVVLVSERRTFENVRQQTSGIWQKSLKTLAYGICCGLSRVLFHITEQSSNRKMRFFSFSSSKPLKDQLWPYRNLGQGKTRVIIYANFVVLECKMLHAKFQEIGPVVLEKMTLKCLFYHICAWRSSWSCDPDQKNILSPSLCLKPHMKFN